jgi:hypothetical protein
MSILICEAVHDYKRCLLFPLNNAWPTRAFKDQVVFSIGATRRDGSAEGATIVPTTKGYDPCKSRRDHPP